MTFNDFIKGVCSYKVRCKNTGDFLNNIRNKTSVKKIEYIDENTISFVCFLNETENVNFAVEKTNAEILTMKKRGFPVFFEKIRKRIGLMAGIFLFVVLIAASTFFVWEIRVEGNEKLTDEEVEFMLVKAGLAEGMLKNRIDVKSIVNKVLISEDALSWLSINLDGTVAHVEVKEAKIGVPAEKKENVNLVASHNGIILRVDALEGQSKVNKGDAVEKGSLLVSAFVEKRTGGSLLRGARGFVWAETERKYRVVVPLEYYEKNYTGKEVNSYKIAFLGKELLLSLPLFGKHEVFERRIVTIENKISEDKKLPFDIVQIKKAVYTPYKSRRPVKTALEIAKKNAEERLKKQNPSFKMSKLSDKYEIVDNNLVYDCVFEGVENIAQKKEFELS